MSTEKGVIINFTLTNHWFYTLIALTLILIVSVTVYAVVDTSKGWYPASQVEGLGALATKDSIDWSEITSGIPAGLSDGDNDSQNLSISGYTITLSGGGGSVTVPDNIHHDHSDPTPPKEPCPEAVYTDPCWSG